MLNNSKWSYLHFFFVGINVLFYTKITPAKESSVAAQDEQASAIEEAPLTLEGSLQLRDPFRKPKLIARSDLDDKNAVPELQRYDLEEFTLVGVITGTKKNKALLSIPSGKMIIVEENTAIGPRKGHIKRIIPGAILIEERVVNLLGQEEKTETTIEFKDKNLLEQRAKL